MTADVQIQAKDMGVDDRLEEYVTKRAEKIDRYITGVQNVKILLTNAKSARNAQDRRVAQITVHGSKFMLRAEERSDDIFSAFDRALDKVHRRIERYKGKHYRGRGNGASVREDAMKELELEAAYEDEGLVEIARRKKFVLLPMDEKEAIEQMKLLGHEDFFIFFNMDTNAVNVLYRRRDDTYGLIETEIG